MLNHENVITEIANNPQIMLPKLGKAFAAQDQLTSERGILKTGGTCRSRGRISSLNAGHIQEEKLDYVFQSQSVQNYFSFEKAIQNELKKGRIPGEGKEKLRVSAKEVLEKVKQLFPKMYPLLEEYLRENNLRYVKLK